MYNKIVASILSLTYRHVDLNKAHNLYIWPSLCSTVCTLKLKQRQQYSNMVSIAIVSLWVQFYRAGVTFISKEMVSLLGITESIRFQSNENFTVTDTATSWHDSTVNLSTRKWEKLKKDRTSPHPPLQLEKLWVLMKC